MEIEKASAKELFEELVKRCSIEKVPLVIAFYDESIKTSKMIYLGTPFQIGSLIEGILNGISKVLEGGEELCEPQSLH